MLNLRTTIQVRMKELNISTAYALWKLVGCKITANTINNYLVGRTEMTAANLELLLNALGAEGLWFPDKSS